jgi:hypothetical protein
MERQQVTKFLKDKAPALALTAVVALGSLALIAEGSGQDPGSVTRSHDHAFEVPTTHLFSELSDVHTALDIADVSTALPPIL